MKSAEEIAADILAVTRPRIDNYPPQDLHRIITQEIRTAQREALEAAAVICTDLNSTPMECAVDVAAHRIRALITKKEL